MTAETATLNLGRRASEVCREIHRQIDSGRWPVNSRLPTVDELCELYRVSRTTIQKVLDRLSAEGRIRTLRGSGCFVQPVERPVTNALAVMFAGSLELLTGVQDLITAGGSMMTLYSQNRNAWQPSSEELFLEQVLAQRPRALLAFCSPRPGRSGELLERIRANGTRTIHIEYCRPSVPEGEYVLADYVGMGRAAAVAALLAGYRRIYFVDMKRDGPFAALMRSGVEETLRLQDGLTGGLADWSAKEGRHFRFLLPRDAENEAQTPVFKDLARHVGREPAAFICSTADRGRIVRSRLAEMKVDVPGQVGVIGLSPLGEPRRAVELDRIDFDPLELFRTAIDAVLNRAPALRLLVAAQRIRCGTMR